MRVSRASSPLPGSGLTRPPGSSGGRFPLGRNRRGGFTFIELMVVVGLIGILFGLAAINLDGMIPKYRLRIAVRHLGTDIETHRVMAISRGIWLGIRYTMDDETYYQLIPPPPKEYPNLPVQERKPREKIRFPGDEFHGVRIRSVTVRGTEDPVEGGSVLVLFSPSGTSGSHAVMFENDKGQSWTLKFNAITGTVDYIKNEEVTFDDFDG